MSPGSADTMEFEAKVRKLEDNVLKCLAAQQFEWKFPTETELATNRQQFKNTYGYSLDFVKEYDLFGENKFYPTDAKGNNELEITQNGQLNLTTKNKAKNRDNDEV